MLQRHSMNINELDFIAGGSAGETARDSFELFDHGLLNDHWNAASMMVDWGNLSSKVDSAWAKAGIQVTTKPFADNVYKKDGKVIPRDEALEHLNKNFKLVPVK